MKNKGIYWSMALLLSLLLVACTNNNESKVTTEQVVEGTDSATIHTASQVDAQEVEDKKTIKSNNGSLIDAKHSGSAFKSYFTCTPDMGNHLNVYVKNNNTSGNVIFKVLKDNQDFEFVDVSAGRGVSRTFTLTDDTSMSGDWKVYVTTTDGHAIDIDVSAGQF